MSTIVLIRAGRTDYDDQSRLLGTLEMPLNADGVRDVDEIVRQLQHDGIVLDAIYTAPSDPGCSTARAIAESQPSAKLKELEELRNVDQGLWQGLPEAEVRKRYPQFFRNGREKPETICPPEGETLCDACERLRKVLNKGIRKYRVLAVVVPDPMASVIRCTLQDRAIGVGSCLSGECDRKAVEVFNVQEFDSDAFIRREARPTANTST
ncbi:MAG: histidine phosphatase family protein [Planctomycetaceae bacterium]